MRELIYELHNKTVTLKKINPENVIFIDVILPDEIMAFDHFDDSLDSFRNMFSNRNITLHDDLITLDSEGTGYTTYYQYAFPPDKNKIISNAILLLVRVICDGANNQDLGKEIWDPISITVNDKQMDGYLQTIEELKTILNNFTMEIKSNDKEIKYRGISISQAREILSSETKKIFNPTYENKESK